MKRKYSGRLRTRTVELVVKITAAKAYSVGNRSSRPSATCESVITNHQGQICTCRSQGFGLPFEMTASNVHREAPRLVRWLNSSSMRRQLHCRSGESIAQRIGNPGEVGIPRTWTNSVFIPILPYSSLLFFRIEHCGDDTPYIPCSILVRLMHSDALT